MGLLAIAVRWIVFLAIVGLIVYWIFFLDLGPGYQWYRDW